MWMTRSGCGSVFSYMNTCIHACMRARVHIYICTYIPPVLEIIMVGCPVRCAVLRPATQRIHSCRICVVKLRIRDDNATHMLLSDLFRQKSVAQVRRTGYADLLRFSDLFSCNYVYICSVERRVPHVHVQCVCHIICIHVCTYMQSLVTDCFIVLKLSWLVS